MQSPNHRPGKLDTLSQHSMETNHRSGKSGTLSQHTQHRQAIPTCAAEYVLYKRGCKNPEQQTSWQSKIAVEPEETCTRRASSYKTWGGWARHMRHRTVSVELGLEDQWIGYKLGPIPCCYCYTTEGEPELTSTKNLQNQALYTLTVTAHSVPLQFLQAVKGSRPGF